MINQSQIESKRLALASSVTVAGDFVTEIAFISIIYKVTGSAVLAGYVIAFQAVGVVLSGVISPRLQESVSTKSILIGSQFLSFFITLLLILAFQTHSQSIFLYGTLLGLGTFLTDLFRSTREIHTKIVEDFGHVKNQTSMAYAGYIAQFGGPLLAVLLLLRFSPAVALFADALSFVITAILLVSSNLTEGISAQKSSTTITLKALFEDKKAILIFSLRTFGFWISAGLFNSLMFAIIFTRLGLDPVYGGVIYALLGFGGIVGTKLVQKRWHSDETAFQLAFYGSLCLGVANLAFTFSTNKLLTVIILLIHGVGMSATAIGSKALRRKIISKDNFARALGAESLVAKGIEGGVSFLAVSLIDAKIFTSVDLMIFCGAVGVAISFVYLQFRENKIEIQDSAVALISGK